MIRDLDLGQTNSELGQTNSKLAQIKIIVMLIIYTYIVIKFVCLQLFVIHIQTIM